MTEPDPVCYQPDCDAPNHCDHHEQPVHHCVDSMADFCRDRARKTERPVQQRRPTK